MRILSLHIDKYKILDDFKIDFDFNFSTFVLIGKNGYGKTTLIECLTEIFVSLIRCEILKEIKKVNIPFIFDLSYILRKEKSIETSFSGEFFTNPSKREAVPRAFLFCRQPACTAIINFCKVP